MNELLLPVKNGLDREVIADRLEAFMSEASTGSVAASGILNGGRER